MMSDETSAPRSVPPPEGAGQDGDITALRREVIEARNLVIKTDNLLKNLHAELKQMGRKHEEQEKRHWMTSVAAYVGFVVLAAGGAIAYANAEVRTARGDAQANESRALALQKDAEKSKSLEQSRREQVPVGLEQVVAHRHRLARGQGGGGVRVQQRGLVHVVAGAVEGGPHGQLDHVEEGPVQRGQLRRQRADRYRLGAARTDQAGHLHAAGVGQAGDQPAVADVHVQLALGPGLEGVDELRGQLAGGLEVQRLVRGQLGLQRLQLAQVLLGPL